MTPHDAPVPPALTPGDHPFKGDARPGVGFVGVLLLALALLLWRAHFVNVDAPARAKKEALHAAVLSNTAPDPYQYKLYTITWAVEGLHRTTHADLLDLYATNALLSLLVLLLAHHAFLRAFFAPREALLGSLLLTGLAHGLFLDYYHHPYDLWGVAGFCLLARGFARGAGLASLAIGSFLLGVIWEKHALLPLAAGLAGYGAAQPFVARWARLALVGACSLALPIAIRMHLGADRALVDVTPLSEQDWGKVLAHQAPYVLPFVVALCSSWRRVPPLVRALWLYVPLMFAAYAASQFILYELRSFWPFAPVFTATAAAAAGSLRGAPSPLPPPPPSGPFTQHREPPRAEHHGLDDPEDDQCGP